MNLLFFLIIVLAFYAQGFSQVFWLAFFLGLLTDLISGNLVGFTSLIILLACFLIYLYRKRFSSSHLLFQLGFVLLSDRLFILLSGASWSFKKSLVLVFASLIIFPLLNKMVARTSGLELEV